MREQLARENEEKLEELSDRSGLMQVEAMDFSSLAKQVRRQAELPWWRK